MVQRLMQLVLDLFEPQSTPAPAPETKQKPASPRNGPDLNAIKKVASTEEPPTPLPHLLTPAEFRHPRARRELLLGDAVVAYAFERARRRSIGFSIGPDGLSVRAPHWVTMGAVDAALRERSAWVLRKLQEARNRQQRQEGGRIVWTEGGSLPYLGEPLVMRLGAATGARGAAVHRASDGAVALHLPLPAHATPEQIRDTVQAWLQREARRHFAERLDHFAPQLGVRWKSLRLSSAQTRWGSARSDGSIRLNWRLLHYRPAVIDYVVVHELSHLRVMDHSPRFWDTVAAVVPDYAALRNHLRDEPAPLWE